MFGERNRTPPTTMSALTEFLFPAPARRTVASIIGWWESRRLGYNLTVGAAGLTSLAIVTTVAHLPPGARGEMGLFPPWQPIVVFALLANVCYLLGPAVEIVVHKLFGRQILPVGPSLFRMGLTFSVGLAFLPTLLILFDWIFRIVRAVV
jgi:hypothetical protein